MLLYCCMVKTLAIETSCDDTSVWIVDFDGQIFSVDSLLAYSQIDDHQKYWWVVPEIASRLHSEKILEVIKNIGLDKIKDVDFISVTVHPWLPGSLVVGKAVASLLSSYFAKPLVHVNHIYGHLFSLLLDRKTSDIQFPLVVLTASGGHNDIYIVNSEKWKVKSDGISFHEFGWYTIAKVGYTLDDAAGECFDKVSRMLGGPYPGGQWIGEKALQGKPNSDVEFKRIFLSKENFEFSFSWMKSQVSFLLKKLRDKEQGTRDEENNWDHVPWTMSPLPEELVCDIAYEFQEAVVEVMVKKLVRAGIAFEAKTLGLAGGVSCNDRLREYLNEYWKLKIENWKFLRPMKKVYSMDNAAMIGLAGILEFSEEWKVKSE